MRRPPRPRPPYRALPSFEDGLPADVVRAVDATLSMGGGVTKHSIGRALQSVRFTRPAAHAVAVLSGLRDAVCVGPDEWVWTPDRSNDSAVEAAPYATHLHLLRAS